MKVLNVFQAKTKTELNNDQRELCEQLFFIIGVYIFNEVRGLDQIMLLAGFGLWISFADPWSRISFRSLKKVRNNFCVSLSNHIF